MNKKIIIILSSVCVVLVGVIIALLVMKNDKKEPEVPNIPDNEPVVATEKVTIKFDTNGGEAVEDLIIDKGAQVLLPSTTRSGYLFDGWYLGDTKIISTYVYNENITVKAKWEKIKEETKTFKVTYDSKGGSKVSAQTVECGKTLTLPKKPTRDGYTFNGWEDKNGKVILDGAKLSCENVTLYAKWEKNETKPVEPTNPEPVKEYKCPSGYTLSGTKCTTETTAKEKCPDGTKVISGGICATVTNSARKDYSRGCPKQMVTYNSFAGEVDGKVVNWGLWGCAYYKTNDTTKENCESHGFIWVTPESACYVKWVGNNTINSCSHLSGYVDIPNPNSYVTNTGLNAGCFPTSSKEKYCENEYILTNGKCVKTIDATLE